MLAHSRIGTKQLAEVCHRVGTSLEAGVDLRKAMAREADRGPLRQRRQMTRINRHIGTGGALADVLADADGYFPSLVCEMVAVGEAMGKLDQVLLRLAEHYSGRLRIRRIFLAGIAWPVLQLLAAVFVIGLLIWILGFVGNTDVLGFGLTGTVGLVKYLVLVVLVGTIFAVLVGGTVRGWFWSRPLQRWIMRVPVLGPSLRTISLSRVAWTMSLTFNSGMEAQRAIHLALRSAENTIFMDHAAQIERDIMGGQPVTEALRSSGVFPADFLDTVAVGEESGRLVESMSRLADAYRERATAAFGVLTVAAGFAVWAFVAAVIIFLIFRLAGFYFGMIRDAASGQF